jgi:hypothetical protein
MRGEVAAALLSVLFFLRSKTTDRELPQEGQVREKKNETERMSFAVV